MKYSVTPNISPPNTIEVSDRFDEFSFTSRYLLRQKSLVCLYVYVCLWVCKLFCCIDFSGIRSKDFSNFAA